MGGRKQNALGFFPGPIHVVLLSVDSCDFAAALWLHDLRRTYEEKCGRCATRLYGAQGSATVRSWGHLVQGAASELTPFKKEKRERGKINDCKANANAQLAVEIKLCLDDSLTRETVASLYFRRLTAAEELPAEPN